MNLRGKNKDNTYNSFRNFLWIEWTTVYEVWDKAKKEANEE